MARGGVSLGKFNNGELKGVFGSTKLLNPKNYLLQQLHEKLKAR